MRESDVLDFTDRATRGLLNLYPREFRLAMAEDLRLCVRAAVRDRLRRAGWWGALSFGLVALFDLARAGLIERAVAWRAAIAQRPAGARLAAGGALLGGLGWLGMTNNLALRLLPPPAGMVSLALAALGFGLCGAGVARLHGAALSPAGRLGLGAARLGALPPFVLGLLRATGRPIPFADYMDAMLFLQLGLVLVGATNLRGGPLRGTAAWALLMAGLASFWVGVGERHGFSAPAMLIPLELFGALWIVIALDLWRRHAPADGRPADGRPRTA
jgi:hypothetical protein